ncbi:MAG: hypothetical protein V1712_03990 [Patescibacteria group bacterium]
MNNFYNQRKILAIQPAGQGLLEAMLAIGLILIGLGAVLTLTLKNISAVIDSGQRVVAVNLAREGIDVVRGIRDSNWLAASNSDPNRLWDHDYDDSEEVVAANLVPSADDQGARAILTLPSSTLIAPVNFSIDFIDSRDVNDDSFKLYRDSATYEWYQEDFSLNKETGFNRMILLDPICESAGVKAGESDCPAGDVKIGIRVQVQVAWNTTGIFGGINHRQLEVTEYLYNWR